MGDWFKEIFIEKLKGCTICIAALPVSNNGRMDAIVMTEKGGIADGSGYHEKVWQSGGVSIKHNFSICGIYFVKCGQICNYYEWSDIRLI